VRDIYSVRMLEGASRDLQRLDPAVGRHIVRRLQWLAENLQASKPALPIGELTGLYLLWDEDYPIVYELLARRRTVLP